MLEIERKFLVRSDGYKKEVSKSSRILQGFLNSDKERTVRVRVKDDQSFLTVKGLSSEDGLSRFEWEIEINSEEAMELLKLSEPGVINKIRHEVLINNHIVNHN